MPAFAETGGSGGSDQFWRGTGLKTGRGSLAWEIEVLPADEIVAHIIKPSSGPRLPDFIEGQESAGTWLQAKPAVFDCLLKDRRRESESDATLLMGRLVAAADSVAWNVLYPNERDPFLLVDVDYFKARAVLEAYGVLLPLPKRARKYGKPKEKALLPILSLCISPEESPGTWEEDEDLKSRFDQLSEDHQSGLYVFMTAFRIKTTVDVLASLFGERFSAKIEKALLSDVFRRTEEERSGYLQWAIRTMRAAEKHVRLNKPDESLDLATVVLFSDHFIPEDTADDEDVSGILKTASEILGAERTGYSQKLRFMLAKHFRRVGPQDLPQDPNDPNAYAWENWRRETDL